MSTQLHDSESDAKQQAREAKGELPATPDDDLLVFGTGENPTIINLKTGSMEGRGTIRGN